MTVTPGHHLPDPQAWAIAQERQHHDDALFSFGEYAMFVLMWTIVDFDAGLVDHCPTCYVAYGKTAAAYGQPARRECPDCYGTTFRGGYKAQIVRPSLWDFNEPDLRESSRGQVTVSTASVQSTSDFLVASGDYIFRADGTRWALRSTGTNHLRTGFQTPTRGRTALGTNYGMVQREDQAAVSFTIPPTESLLAEMDVPAGTRYPKDFAHLETIRGPLL